MQILWRVNCLDSTGYSNAARGYILGLHRLGVNIKVENVDHGYPRVKLPNKDMEDLEACMTRPKEKEYVFIDHQLAPGFRRDENALRSIGFTVCETDKVLKTWADGCNRMDALIVPSRHNMQAFRESGVNVPIEYARHGISLNDTDEYPDFIDEDMPNFKFLSVFQWSFRKGYDVLLKAFWEEFKETEDVALVIKTYDMKISSSSTQNILGEIKHLKQSLNYNNTAPIYVYTQMLSANQMKALYNNCDAFILPSRGEGVGLPYMEAMGTGLPTIGTGWGGQTDFMTHSNSYLLDYTMSNVRNLDMTNYSPDMMCAEPNINQLKKYMRDVFDNYAQAKMKGQKAKEDIEKYFTWEQSAVDIINAVQRISGRKL